MYTAQAILSVLLAILFIGSGGIKLAGTKQSLQIRDRLGIDARLWSAIGGLEVAGAVGLLVGLVASVLGVAAAAGLSLLMIGALVAHGRASDLRHVAPAVLMLVLSVALVIVARQRLGDAIGPERLEHNTIPLTTVVVRHYP
jgi:peptidoglycan/LPS O-acetylase OafA/YrhL